MGLVAFAGSLLLLHGVWSDPWHRSPGNAAGAEVDPVQFMWFLRWVPWALAHGQSPLHTDAIDLPTGVSLAWNPSVPTLGLAVSPVTLTAGPVFAFNLLLLLAPVATAVSSFRWLRRHVVSSLAAGVGAVAFAFSPYVAGHLQGHLHLVFLPLVPLSLLLLEDLLWRAPRPRWKSGVALGVVLGLQVGISEEVLLFEAIGVAVAALWWWVQRPVRTVRVLARAAGAAVLALGTAVAVASYVLSVQLLRAPHLAVNGGAWAGAVSDWWHPAGRVVNPFGLALVTRFNDSEVTDYLGVVVLAVLTAGAVLLVRDVRVRTAVLTVISAMVLSLGPRSPGGMSLPWSLVTRIPFVSNTLPIRMSLITWLAVSWLLAVFLDRALSQRSVAGRLSVTGGLSAAAVVAAAVSVAPLPISTIQLRTPGAFTTSALAAAVPAGAAVVVLPMADARYDQPMLWQAQAGFRFRMTGGYALRPSPDGGGDPWPPDTPLYRAAAAIRDGREPAVGDLPAAREELRTGRFAAILVALEHPNERAYSGLATKLAGHPPQLTAGGIAFYELRPTA